MNINLDISQEEQDKIEKALAIDGRYSSIKEIAEAFIRQIANVNAVLFDETIASNSDDPRFLVPPLNKVHPCKRKQIQTIIDTCPDCIEQVWVFGSTITPYCRTTSDVDLLFIMDIERWDEYSQWSRTVRWFAKDTLITSMEDFKQRNRGVYKEIKTKGIRIV